MPFTRVQFFEVFRLYNEGVWPAQVGLYLIAAIGIASVALRWRGWRQSAYLLLAVLWLWVAVAYHLLYFWQINAAAPLFAIISAGTAAVFLRRAFSHGTSSNVNWAVGTIVALLLIVYALVLYPLIGWVLGHRSFGLLTVGLPCPTTIYTIGLLSVINKEPARVELVGPALWAAIGSTAALYLSVYQDYGLLVAGIWAVVLLTPLRYTFGYGIASDKKEPLPRPIKREG